jgi:periplasmic protein TonB
VASPASNASRGHETGAGAPSSAGSTPASTNKPAVDLTAITTRDDFLLELGEALGGQASVRPVDSIAGALEYITSVKRGQVLVIDTRDLTDVRADVEQAHTQAPHAVVLVFATTETEKQVSAAVKGSNAFAVLPIPIDKRKTGAVLDAAMNDAVAKKATARPSASQGMSVESFQPRLETGSSEPPEPEKSKAPLFIAVGVVAVALAGGGYFYLNGSKHVAPAPSATAAKTATAAPSTPAADSTAAGADARLEPTPTVDMSIVKGKVDDLLEKARLAMRERRYLEPVGDNALLYYRSAAAADPNNGEAKDGMQRVASVAASRFEESMTAGKYDDASLALANLKVAAPEDPRNGQFELKLFLAQVAKALADGNVDRAQALARQAQSSPNIPADQLAKVRADIARHQDDAKVQKLAGLVSDRIRDGRLVDPPEDSAKTYVQQLHDLAPSNPNTQRAMRELNSAYLRKARDTKNSTEADRWIAEARAGGMSAAEIASVQRDLANQRQKAAAQEAERLVQATRDRIRDGRLSDPPNDSANYYLTQLQAADPTNAAFAQVSKELANKLLDRARSAAAAGKPTEPDLTLARHWGADQKDILAITQSQMKIPAPTTGGANRSVAGNPSGLTATQLAASLKRTKYTPPEFPPKALAQKISGAVTVEYVVDTSGNPRDVRVVEATPPGVFDKAAITAIKHWHYDPVIANGAPVEVPVRTAIRFELPSQ